jgi:hypothetical protein
VSDLPRSALLIVKQSRRGTAHIGTDHHRGLVKLLISYTV